MIFTILHNDPCELSVVYRCDGCGREFGEVRSRRPRCKCDGGKFGQLQASLTTPLPAPGRIPTMPRSEKARRIVTALRKATHMGDLRDVAKAHGVCGAYAEKLFFKYVLPARYEAAMRATALEVA